MRVLTSASQPPSLPSPTAPGPAPCEPRLFLRPTFGITVDHSTLKVRVSAAPDTPRGDEATRG